MPKKDQEQVVIQGPSGDVIQIGRDDFEKSHYAEQGYEIAGPVPIDDMDDAAEHEVRDQIVKGANKLASEPNE